MILIRISVSFFLLAFSGLQHADFNAKTSANEGQPQAPQRVQPHTHLRNSATVTFVYGATSEHSRPHSTPHTALSRNLPCNPRYRAAEMSRTARGSTTPMDFEYQNGTGPVNEQSPFLAGIPVKKRKCESFASEPTFAAGEPLFLTERPTGTHSVLESPSKGGFSTPNRLRLQEPNGKPVLFSQATKPLPAVPSHVQDAWAPRTPASTINDSSGGETPNTPGQDSDASTPGTQIAAKMGRFGLDGDGRSKSPKKSRSSAFLKSIFSSSPSPAKEDSKYYSKKAENRVMKRRSKNRKVTSRDEYDSDDAQHTKAQQLAHASQPHHPGDPGYAVKAGNFFSWVEAHPYLPTVLSFWFQLLVNTVLGLTFLYLVYSTWNGVMSDVNIESKKYEAEVMTEIAICAENWRVNRCESPVPAMHQACMNWEGCMNRDPKQVARASVSAKTFAMILNAFVEEFSYKSMVWITFFIFLKFILMRYGDAGIQNHARCIPHHASLNYVPDGFCDKRQRHQNQWRQHHDVPCPGEPSTATQNGLPQSSAPLPAH